MSKIYSIYGAKYSKKGDRVNINLIGNGENESKEFACVSLAKDSSKIKIVKDENGAEFVYLKINISKDKAEKKDKTDKKEKPSLPF